MKKITLVLSIIMHIITIIIFIISLIPQYPILYKYPIRKSITKGKGKAQVMMGGVKRQTSNTNSHDVVRITNYLCFLVFVRVEKSAFRKKTQKVQLL